MKVYPWTSRLARVSLIGAIVMTLPWTSSELCARPSISSEAVAPVVEDARYYFSPEGSRVAVVMNRGSRHVVVVDGQEGPRFDGILSDAIDHTNGSEMVGRGALGRTGKNEVLFSRDGKHFAYAAVDGADTVVIHDGKEVFRTKTSLYAVGGMSKRGLNFSPTGKRLYFLTSANSEGNPGIDRLVIDGKAGEPFNYDLHNFRIMFNGDDSHYAYVVMAVTANGKQTPSLIVNGKVQSGFGESPQFVGDGKNWVAIARGEGGKDSLLADGKVKFSPGGAIHKVLTAKQGDTVAVIYQSGPAQQDRKLWLDGKTIETANQVFDVWLSENGKHWAALCGSSSPGDPKWMVIDGRKGANYQQIDVTSGSWTPRFAADGKRFVYIAFNAGKRFVVVNEEESDGFTQIPVPSLSADGQKLAIAHLDSVVIDGKRINAIGADKFQRVRTDSLEISPDGRHVAYVADVQGKGACLIADGVVYADFQINAAAMGPGRNKAGYFVMNPKTGAPVFPSQNKKTRQRGLWEGTTLLYELKQGDVSPDRVLVTKDGTVVSRYVERVQPASGRPQFNYVYMANGERVHEVNRDGTFVDAATGSWQLGEDGKLRFLTVEGDQVMRHTVSF
jgi:DNA-binding beta-propeller fold protein YncE